MVSDSSLEELHDFAAALEIPLRGFHGDHYDVPSYIREVAITRGAHEVTSRQLLMAIRAAGLRLTAAQRRAYKNNAEDDQGSGEPARDRGQ